MSIGYLKDVPDPAEMGYGGRVHQEYKQRWNRHHTCKDCGVGIKWVTRDDGKRFPIDLEVTPKGKWLYRKRPDGTYSWAGSGPGHKRHDCRRSE